MDDISVFGLVFSGTLDLLKIEVTLYGHTISLWQVFVWSVVASVLIGFIFDAFSGE